MYDNMSTIPAETSSLTWNIDTTHSSIDFSVKHLGVFTVRGALGPVTGTASSTDGDLTSLALSIDVAGISTNNEQRDAHLKSADFLNVDEFPTATFQSTEVIKTGDATYTGTGDFTLHGVTKSLSLQVEATPAVTDPWGNNRGGGTGTGSLLRSDFGLTYNSVLESGHALLSDEVKFTFDIQAVSA